MWAFCTPQFALRVWSGVCDSRLPLSDDGCRFVNAGRRVQSLTDAVTKRGRLRWLFTLPAHVQQTQSCCPGLAAHRLSRRLIEEAGKEEAASGGAPKATLADCGHRARPSKDFGSPTCCAKSEQTILCPAAVRTRPPHCDQTAADGKDLAHPSCAGTKVAASQRSAWYCNPVL